MVRFISESVMAGFVTGVAVLMILGQLSKLTGYHSEVSGNTLVIIFTMRGRDVVMTSFLAFLERLHAFEEWAKFSICLVKQKMFSGG